MSSHVAESPVVAAPTKSSLPVQAVVYLVTVLGAAVALGGRFIFDVNAGDINRLAATRSGVAWCPTSNMRLGSGFAPVQSWAIY